MVGESPAVINFNTDGYEVGIEERPFRVDPTGDTSQPVNDGGGSLTVDGSVAVSGGVLADQGDPTTLDNAWPVHVTDGYEILGTSTDPIRVDPTGTTAQPVTDNGGSLTVDDGGLSLTVDGTVAVSGGNITVDGEVISDQGDPNTLDNAWPVHVTDGYEILGTNTDPIRVDPTGTTPQPVTDNGGSLTVDGTVAVSGGNITVDGNIVADQGDPNTLDNAWPVHVTDGYEILGTDTDPIRIDPTGTTAQPVTDNGGSLTVDDGGSSISVDDNGGSLTVDDGGISLTVDGTVTVSDGNIIAEQGDPNTLDNAWPVHVTDGYDILGTQTDPIRIDPTGTTAQPVTDNGGSLTVDQATAANLNAQVQGPAADGATPVGNPVLVAGQDGSNVQSLLTDTSGRPQVVGAAADGAIADGNPVLTAGADDTGNVQTLLTDPQGRSRVVGAADDGDLIDGYPVLVAGADENGIVQTMRTDTTGRQEVVGAAADGEAVAGDPVRMAGSDGTITRDILTDTGGRQIAVGAAADGATPVGNPVLTAGFDGTNVQTELTDTSGRQRVVGAAADGAAATGDPVLTAGADSSSNVQTIRTDTTGRQEMVGAVADGGAADGNPVLVAGADEDNNVQTLLTDLEGRLNVVGAAEDGTPIDGYPVLVAGADENGDVQTLHTDTVGRQEIVGAAADGEAVAGDPVRVAGSDGSVTRDMLTDTGGRQVVVGGAADGAIPVGNPVLTAGFDGTNVQTELTDTSGRQRVVGAAASGAAVAGDPVRVAGSDGTTTRDVLTDTGGRQVAVGAAADGATPVGNPLLMAGQDGTNVQSIKTNSVGRLEQVLFDGSGNPVAVILDNSIYRLETRSTIVGQQAGTGAETKVTVIEDPTTATHKRLQVEAAFKPGSTVNVVSAAGELTTVTSDFFETTGGSSDMVVDGSITPVEFLFEAADGYNTIISAVRFVFVAGSILFSGTDFGKGGGILSNGITIGGEVNNGKTIDIATLTVNEDFLRLQGRAFTEFSGINDILVASIEFGGRTLLDAGSNDNLTITIRDNLTLGSRDIKYLTATFFGVAEEA